jgi:hypothetical protein
VCVWYSSLLLYWTRPQGSQHNWHAFSMLIRLNPGHRSSMAIYSDMVKFKTCVIHTHFHWP